MTNNVTYADLEIRILKQEQAGYPVEITLNNMRQFKRGYLKPGPETESWDSIVESVEAGQRLFEWFLTDSNLKEAWGQVREQRPQRIRLRIDREAPELHLIPWELLQEPGEGDLSQNLAQNLETPFSRYLAGTWNPGQPILKRPLKMLVGIANPESLEATYNLSPIDLDQEWSSLESVIQGTAITCDLLPQPCTLSSLEDKLKEGYHLLHFIGHGSYNKKRGEAVLYMADEANQVALVKDKDFATMLASQLANSDLQAEDKLRLVFLASCQTANRSPADAFRGFAPMLVDAGAPAVLAMQALVSTTTARTFTRTFYQQLLTHGLVDQASNEARAKVQTEQKSGAAIPVLFMRLPDGRLLIPHERSQSPVMATQGFEPEMVYISAGKFLMGNDRAEGIPEHEAPLHEVYLPAYRIGKYPVTNEQYWEFVKDKGYDAPKIGWIGRKPRKDRLNHPVVEISWDDAQAYCLWLAAKTGRFYRLPSEAEWEKAARGPNDQRAYPWGNAWAESRCNYNSNQTTPVDAYPAQSEYGCYDLVGNVREWTRTLWGDDLDEAKFPYPWANDDREDPKTAEQYSRAYRIYRGGSYSDPISQLRCSARDWYALDIRNKYCGFRVVAEI